MRLRSWLVWGGLLSWMILGAGCADETSHAPASGGGKGPIGSGGSKPTMDAGDEADEDGGSDTVVVPPGEPLRIECYKVDPVTFVGETAVGDFVNAISAPSDLVVTRVLATWDMGCEPARIRISMSSGRCPSGDGHELSFFIDAQAIVDGTFGEGVNTINAESDTSTISVRYTRPDRFDPSGTWGSCTDSNGTLSIRGEIDPNHLQDVQGQFQLELTACDGKAEGVQSLNGTFNVNMRRNLDDVCPAKK